MHCIHLGLSRAVDERYEWFIAVEREGAATIGRRTGGRSIRVLRASTVCVGERILGRSDAVKR